MFLKLFIVYLVHAIKIGEAILHYGNDTLTIQPLTWNLWNKIVHEHFCYLLNLSTFVIIEIISVFLGEPLYIKYFFNYHMNFLNTILLDILVWMTLVQCNFVYVNLNFFNRTLGAWVTYVAHDFGKYFNFPFSDTNGACITFLLKTLESLFSFMFWKDFLYVEYFLNVIFKVKYFWVTENAIIIRVLFFSLFCSFCFWSSTVGLCFSDEAKCLIINCSHL